ncbi:MAG: nitrogen fixation protein FixH [Burkholderiaceae bacterium]|nr:nitrogen fixation protein FixH [Burkholderiaceae bacterium]
MMKPTDKPGTVLRPWWREPMVWLVIGGPATVVVAAIATGIVAWRGADPLVLEAPVVSAAPSNRALEPALTARNHAATPH